MYAIQSPDEKLTCFSLLSAGSTDRNAMNLVCSRVYSSVAQ